MIRRLGPAAALALLLGSCKESTEPTRIVCASSGAPSPEVVAMTCAGRLSDVTERIDIVVGGPTGEPTTVRGFNFDIQYDPASLEFVADAAYTSPLFPDAFVAVSLLDGQQGRVVVTVQQPGTLPDVAFGSGKNKIIGLTFRRVPGATFDHSRLVFQNADAIGASKFISFVANVSLSYL